MKMNRVSSKLEVKQGIHGVGIFATTDIKKGEVIFTLDGEIIDHPTRTSVQIGKNKHIENFIAGRVNHSCHPNAKVQRRAPIAFVSTHHIKKGEEITFDYNQNEDYMASPFKCACCRRWIAGKKAVLTGGVRPVTIK